MASKQNDKPHTGVEREVYPKPAHRFSNAKIGMTYRESKPDFPLLDEAPRHAPNVVVVLLDDVGYGGRAPAAVSFECRPRSGSHATA